MGFKLATDVFKGRVCLVMASICTIAYDCCVKFVPLWLQIAKWVNKAETTCLINSQGKLG